MHLIGICMFEQRVKTAVNCRRQAGRGQAGNRLRAVAAVMLMLTAGNPAGMAQQVAGAGATAPDKAASELPSAPSVTLTEPLDLRSSARDFSKPAGRLLGNPINMYRPTTIGKASFSNSVRLTELVKDGKIYLSLSDAIALALENNFDIAIARYDLDIADTDILRTRTGAGAAGRPHWTGHRHPGWLDLDFDHRRRSRRYRGRLWRRGFRLCRVDADHSGRRPDAGSSGTLRHRHDSVGAG